MPYSRLPSPATIASDAIKTGVEQGEEKIPPRIPARKAPKKPRRLFLEIRLTDGMKLKISQVCKAISTIKTPSTAYQIGEEVPISLPIEVATIPKVTKVIAVPAANVAEYKNAFLVFLSPVPPTYPTINGTLEREQGVTEVHMPATNANTGASHIFSPSVSAI